MRVKVYVCVCMCVCATKTETESVYVCGAHHDVAVDLVKAVQGQLLIGPPTGHDAGARQVHEVLDWGGLGG